VINAIRKACEMKYVLTSTKDRPGGYGERRAFVTAQQELPRRPDKQKVGTTSGAIGAIDPYAGSYLLQ
jgi:hypothetical protein